MSTHNLLLAVAFVAVCRVACVIALVSWMDTEICAVAPATAAEKLFDEFDSVLATASFTRSFSFLFLSLDCSLAADN